MTLPINQTIPFDGFKAVIKRYVPKYTNKWVVTVKWMSGDADVYTEDDFRFEDKLENLQRIYDATKLLSGKRLSGRGHRELDFQDLSYEDQQLFIFFFGGYIQEEWEELKVNGTDDWGVRDYDNYEQYLASFEPYDGWERDRSCDDCGYAQFDSFEVRWYDESGKAHPVVMEKIR